MRKQVLANHIRKVYERPPRPVVQLDNKYVLILGQDVFILDQRSELFRVALLINIVFIKYYFSLWPSWHDACGNVQVNIEKS